ncbi:response regulator [Halovulum marinum]|uniref:hypothetical protein n=1 Tax=Halovulum marinum TaxID=2662447 RepID=UPI001F354333|nr:hypothetical protein [Halovulum marinum]
MNKLTDIRGHRLLIAEDDFILASDLAEFFSEAGARIVGPFPTLERALAHAAYADAAVLDVNLRGRKVFPLADLFTRIDVPFVFYTGYGCENLPDRFQIAEKLSKPLPASLYVAADGGEVYQHLPNLRLAARLLRHGVEAADRLVERTLEAAIARHAERPRRVSAPVWLIGLMMQIAHEEDGSRARC